MTGFRATDHEINHNASPTANGAIESGIVQVSTVSGTYFDSTDGEPVLVNVLLSRGPEETRRELWCRISQPLNFIPAPGTPVMVAVPAGFGYTPGASMIIGCAGNAPPNQFGAAKAKLDFGPDADVVIKARSITLTDYENRYLTLGPTYGIKMGDATASGAILKDARWAFYVAESGDAKAVFELATDKVQLIQKDDKQVAFLLQHGKFTSAGEIFDCKFGGGYFGKAPTGATPCTYGASTASAGSLAWFMSPS